ncbi:MAG TPA: putative ABC transporter permease [Lachnospiraceae bacterium]|nr:putative ABC transporter permease [Lachnospiraceae bacterium]
MWTKEIGSTDVYHLVFCFIIYSMLGWLVESIYISACNRKITNRGFATSPCCPIYGMGGILGFVLLNRFIHNSFILYVIGAFIATLFEFLVAKLMIQLFDEVWWDYHDKPFNYKGIICLESTIAWGFYAVIIVKYLHFHILEQVEKVSMRAGLRFCRIVIAIYFIDFTYHLLRALGINMSKYRNRIIDQYHEIRTRF